MLQRDCNAAANRSQPGGEPLPGMPPEGRFGRPDAPRRSLPAGAGSGKLLPWFPFAATLSRGPGPEECRADERPGKIAP